MGLWSCGVLQIRFKNGSVGPITINPIQVMAMQKTLRIYLAPHITWDHTSDDNDVHPPSNFGHQRFRYICLGRTWTQGWFPDPSRPPMERLASLKLNTPQSFPYAPPRPSTLRESIRRLPSNNMAFHIDGALNGTSGEEKGCARSW